VFRQPDFHKRGGRGRGDPEAVHSVAAGRRHCPPLHRPLFLHGVLRLHTAASGVPIAGIDAPRIGR